MIACKSKEALKIVCFYFCDVVYGGKMGTIKTRKIKIEKIRNILVKAQEKEKGIEKDKLIAIMMMDGCSRNNVVEIIKSFIDLGEAVEKIEDEVCNLYYAK